MEIYVKIQCVKDLSAFISVILSNHKYAVYVTIMVILKINMYRMLLMLYKLKKKILIKYIFLIYFKKITRCLQQW